MRNDVDITRVLGNIIEDKDADSQDNVSTATSGTSQDEGQEDDVSISNDKKEEKQQEYVPASTEDYIMNHFEDLGYNNSYWKNAEGCPIWDEPKKSTQENYDNLQAYLKEIEDYSLTLKNFDKEVPNLVKTMRKEGYTIDQKELCKAARPHPHGIKALFPSNQLSLTAAGYVEPLLTPMRHPKFCETRAVNKEGMRMDYLIHDFEQLCLNLKPSSMAILIDMGASLNFHSTKEPPIVTLLNSFEKFGFHFDHIYGFEITETNPNKVYKDLLPEKYLHSYHWINTGVSAGKEDKLNPLRSIVSQFDKDDLIIVKLDIDTSDIELPLANQLLEDDSINKLVDHFYFEHHVHMKEIAANWNIAMKGSIQDSFELMNGLRNKGVAAHFWV
eukprot:CAMPEP_0203675702 /NCGR_PEP_ID=MMETSP0090-20130426/21826_1 /ASSEMBLY_ACC=CAM_ASM_001088 /TAXON_ID=426623 /ORGANISM="Chaetoceros affinis, Strain CCMP159" /LENGTH=385 /DNA_ID=CAMNT_0050541999 /DNA_START=74 /DNA_END=1231 /DNA_ORIENTATION=+